MVQRRFYLCQQNSAHVIAMPRSTRKAAKAARVAVTGWRSSKNTAAILQENEEAANVSPALPVKRSRLANKATRASSNSRQGGETETQQSSQSDQKQSDSAAMVHAQFEEDNNLVEAEVHANEFMSKPSDGEVPSESEEEMDTVEDPSADESQVSVNNNATRRCPESASETEGDEVVLGQSTHDENDRATHKAVQREYCRSVEQKLDTLTNAVAAMQNMVQNKLLQPTGKSNKHSQHSTQHAESVTTIYKDAVPHVENMSVTREVGPIMKRVSSSSEEDPVDTSGENIGNDEANVMDMADCFVVVADGHAQMHTPPWVLEGVAGTSNRDQQREFTEPLVAMSRAEQMIHEAESTKARLLATPGRLEQCPQNFMQSTMYDEDYLIVGAHVDDT